MTAKLGPEAQVIVWPKLGGLVCLLYIIRVYGYLTGTTKSTGPNDEEWDKHDNLVELWIYGTISKALVKRVLKKNLKVSDVWKNLKDVFYDNKDVRAPVLEKSLIAYAINGLGNKFDHVASIIRHRDPIPNFDTARFMLLLEEIILNRVKTTQALSVHHPRLLFSSQPLRKAHVTSTQAGHAHSLVTAEATFGSNGLPLPIGFCYTLFGPHVDYGSNVMYTTLPQAFNTMTLQEGGDAGW
ncbi:hypothetical protein Tco_1459442 [Tanacetum coccineum]